MTPIVHAFSKALYSRLKEDLFLQKNSTGVFTHAPSNIQSPYLIYRLSPFKYLGPVFEESPHPTTMKFENRATGELQIASVSEDGHQVLLLIEHIQILIHQYTFLLKENDKIIGEAVCHLLRQTMNETILQRRHHLQISFESFIRF